ncbi:carbohydrate-binding module family 1 protein [Parathielavia hyrcaniae]|uniref:Pectate lyase n=1 Tax=Parathielavia hyrcaniae TaxID=113614 RepID=A0AAN6PQ87_9PEZI|nr:carbohydrate-binding module family 1 protein [Parathielavia hyrcaniae]
MKSGVVFSISLLGVATGVKGAATTTFPQASGETALPTPLVVSGSFDGGMKRYNRNPDTCQDQTETNEAAAMFIVEDGGSISNVVIGKAQGEGIHCRGACTLRNVWWEDVCEDAATFKQAAGKTSYVIGGGARGADDKIFQFNGRGTVSIKDFYAEDYGKVIRTCGDCTGNGGPRHVIIDGVIAKDGGPLCGINTNYGDTCRISNSCQDDGKSCDRYTGVVKGNGSSKKIGTGPDGSSCFVTNLTETCSGGVGSPTTTARTTTARTSTTTSARSTTTSASSGGTVPLYGQCGGNGYNGPATCAQGTCRFSNEWYSQCVL